MGSPPELLDGGPLTNMIIYKDIFTGDEVASDSYPCEIIDDAILKVEGKYVTEGGETFDIGGNPAEGEDDDAVGTDQVTVINIVQTHRLMESPYDKKGYKAVIKAYMKRVKEYLDENDPDAVQPFMAGCQNFVKDILSDFGEWQFFMSESLDPDSMLILCKYGEDGMTPYFYYFLHGLQEMKC